MEYEFDTQSFHGHNRRAFLGRQSYPHFESEKKGQIRPTFALLGHTVTGISKEKRVLATRGLKQRFPHLTKLSRINFSHPNYPGISLVIPENFLFSL